MNKSKIRHICFDKDGTIIDVHGYWAHICGLRADRLCGEIGLSSENAELISQEMGIDTDSMMIRKTGPVGYAPRSEVILAAHRALKAIGVDFNIDDIDSSFRSVDAYQRESNDYHISVLPCVEEALAELKDLGIKLSIYSSDRSFNSRRIMESLGLAEYISSYAGGDTVEKSKPDPEGFLAMCTTVGCPANRSAYVGDTVSDMEMASMAGCLGIGVLTGLDDRQTLEASSSVVLTSLDQIKAKLF